MKPLLFTILVGVLLVACPKALIAMALVVAVNAAIGLGAESLGRQDTESRA